MTRRFLWPALLGLALATPALAETQTYFGFHIGIGNAPPPPRVVFYDEPEVVYVRSAGVYVVDSRYDYDIFRYGGYYYTCHDGYWYRARGYRGPFRAIDVRHVPRRVFSVPERHWKRHWKHSHYARYDDDHRDGKRRSKRGHGRGHGNHD